MALSFYNIYHILADEAEAPDRGAQAAQSNAEVQAETPPATEAQPEQAPQAAPAEQEPPLLPLPAPAAVRPGEAPRAAPAEQGPAPLPLPAPAAGRAPRPRRRPAPIPRILARDAVDGPRSPRERALERVVGPAAERAVEPAPEPAVEPAAAAAPNPPSAPAYTISVSRADKQVFSTFFFSSTQTTGDLPWIDFCKAMRSAGFSMRRSRGSAWKFLPPPSVPGGTIVFHEPHPSSRIRWGKCRGMGRRLGNHYGWTDDTFVVRR